MANTYFYNENKEKKKRDHRLLDVDVNLKIISANCVILKW